MSSEFKGDLDHALMSVGPKTPRNMAETSSRRRLTFLSIAMVALGCINDILAKVLANAYGIRYAFFYNQSVNIIFGLAAWVGYIWHLRTRESIPAALRFPQYKYMIMASMDSVVGLLGTIGSVGTPGTVQLVLNQTAVPFTMICSYLYLNSKYNNREILAAGTVFLGASLSVVPFFSDPTGPMSLIGIGLFTISNFLSSISIVYKENSLTQFYTDVWEMTAFVGLYQVMITFPIAVIQTLPFFSGDPNYVPTISEIFYDFFNGIEFSILEHVLIILIIYCLFNLIYSNISLHITDEGGSVLCSIVYAIKLPISSILFTLPILMGNDFAEALSLWNIVSAVVVIGGFLLYMKESSNSIVVSAPL